LAGLAALGDGEDPRLTALPSRLPRRRRGRFEFLGLWLVGKSIYQLTA